MSSRRVAVTTGGGLKNQAYEMLPVADLAARAAAFNPRKISKHDLDALRRSMREFGVVEPVVLNTRSGRVVGGHQRVRAAQAEGIEALPVVRVDLDGRKEKMLNLALNRVRGEWDDGLLVNLLDELRKEDQDLGLTGFEDAEVEAILRRMIAQDGLTDADKVPGSPKKPVTKPGDLIELGAHRLLCGDSRNAEHVARVMRGEQINVAVTSPPYAEQREYDKSSGFNPVPPSEYVEWFRPVAENVKAFLAANGSWFINIKPSADGLDTDLYVFDLVLAHARLWGWHFATEFCWERIGVPKSVTRRFKNQFEPIYQFTIGEWKMYPEAVRHESQHVPQARGTGAGNTSWAKAQGAKMISAARAQGDPNFKWFSDSEAPGYAYPGNRLPTFGSTHEALGHNAAYPVGLPAFFIRAYSEFGDVVFDPFLGSGSTLIAAQQCNRRCRGIEISPAYCDMIVERFEQFTGQRAQRPARDGKGA